MIFLVYRTVVRSNCYFIFFLRSPAHTWWCAATLNMSRRAKSRKSGITKDTINEDEEKDEVVDLLNFPTSHASEGYDLWITLGCAALIAAVYISTLFPSVPGGMHSYMVPLEVWRRW